MPDRLDILEDILRPCQGIPGDVRARLDSFRDWVRISLPNVRYGCPFVEVICPPCSYRRMAPLKTPISPGERVLRTSFPVASLHRYEIYNRDWQSPFVYWFGTCRTCDSVIWSH